MGALFEGIGAFGTLLGGLLGFSSANKAATVAEEANTQEYELGLQNLEFQKDKLEYDKQLQQQIFQREDNSVQRQAADMEKAGLSKTLAAGGGAGAGAVVDTQAPQAHMNQDKKVLAAQLRAQAIQNATATAQAIANIQLTSEERLFTKEKTRGEKLSNDITEELVPDIINMSGQEYLHEQAKTASTLANTTLIPSQKENIEARTQNTYADTSIKRIERITKDWKLDEQITDYQDKQFLNDFYRQLRIPPGMKLDSKEARSIIMKNPNIDPSLKSYLIQNKGVLENIENMLFAKRNATQNKKPAPSGTVPRGRITRH